MRQITRAAAIGAAVAAGFLFSLASISRAGTITYDFNNGTLGGLTVLSQSAGYSYNVSGGTLNVSAAADTGNGNIVFQTPFDVSGDFIATIDATRADLAAGGDMVIEQHLSSGNWADVFESGPTRIGSVISDPSRTDVGANDSTTTVRLQLQRTGNTLTESYSDDGGGTYTVLQSRTDPSYVVANPIIFYFDQEVGNPAAQSGYFDNFSITSDSIAATPLPSSLLGGIALLLTLGAFGCYRRVSALCPRLHLMGRG